MKIKRITTMKKIMFNDKYGLTKKVLEGQKTMTRRIAYTKDMRFLNLGWDVKTHQHVICDGELVVARSQYKIDEVVAISQSYKDIYLNSGNIYKIGLLGRTAGWRNKMFVCADDMPHHIKITNIRVERLQDISDEDCLREGVYLSQEEFGKPSTYTFSDEYLYMNPRSAFKALIDKVSGKGTWDSNPLVWVYEFELVD